MTIDRFGLVFQYQIKQKKRMYKNICKLKILYKCINANTSAIYGSICCTYHQLKYSSPKRSNPPKKDQSHTKESTFQKLEV